MARAPALNVFMDRYAELNGVLNDRIGGTSLPDTERRIRQIFRMRTPVGHPNRDIWVARIRRLINWRRYLIAANGGKPLPKLSKSIEVGSTVIYRADHIIQTGGFPYTDPRCYMRGTVVGFDGSFAVVDWSRANARFINFDWAPVGGRVFVSEGLRFGDPDIRKAHPDVLATPGSPGAHAKPKGWSGGDLIGADHLISCNKPEARERANPWLMFGEAYDRLARDLGWDKPLDDDREPLRVWERLCFYCGATWRSQMRNKPSFDIKGGWTSIHGPAECMSERRAQIVRALGATQASEDIADAALAVAIKSLDLVIQTRGPEVSEMAKPGGEHCEFCGGVKTGTPKSALEHYECRVDRWWRIMESAVVAMANSAGCDVEAAGSVADRSLKEAAARFRVEPPVDPSERNTHEDDQRKLALEDSA